MIHSVNPQYRTAAKICFVLVIFEKWGRTNKMCEYSDHYQPGLRSASWIKNVSFDSKISTWYGNEKSKNGFQSCVTFREIAILFFFLRGCDEKIEKIHLIFTLLHMSFLEQLRGHFCQNSSAGEIKY